MMMLRSKQQRPKVAEWSQRHLECWDLGIQRQEETYTHVCVRNQKCVPLCEVGRNCGRNCEGWSKKTQLLRETVKDAKTQR